MPHQLTPAQLELQAARRAAKEAKAALIAANPKAALTPEEVESRRFLKREWIENPSAGSSRGSNKAKIVTWNLLAQTLIRKDLFPGSDCLRWPERKPMFLAELEHYSDADILCFQECDRLEEFLPALPDHVNLHCKGPGKQHGLVIMYRQSKYEVKASFKVLLDEGELSSTPTPEGDDLATSRQRKGVSRKTNNVGLIAALKDIKTGEGIVVVTTHLFWHPIFVYERTRQVIVLLRAIAAFKAKHDCESWPTVVAGDFNIEPDVATYQLMTKPQAQLPKELETQITTSRVVHDSVDKFYRRKEGLPIPDPAPIDSQAGTGSNTPAQNSGEAVQPESVVEEEGEAEGGGQGSVSTSTPDDAQPQIKNTRPAEAADGIATYDELLDTIRTLLPNGLESSYRSYDSSPDQMGFGKRDGFKATFSTIPDGLAGHDEPAYTCYTSLFQLTLDYLFLYPDGKVKVTQLLRPARREELGSGLPSKAICPSDHLAMGCEISW